MTSVDKPIDVKYSQYSVEVSKMPNILCTSCKASMMVSMGANALKVIGSCVCVKCNTGTGFELERDTVVYVSGKSSYGSLGNKLPDIAKTLYAEAEACFQAGAPNASTAMCRASIEAALIESGHKGSSLYDQIMAAKTTNALDDVEVGLAHASRLITREAIHRGELVQLSDVPSMLSATVRILNKLFPN
jgi:hypothetical protein